MTRLRKLIDANAKQANFYMANVWHYEGIWIVLVHFEMYMQIPQNIWQH